MLSFDPIAHGMLADPSMVSRKSQICLGEANIHHNTLTRNVRLDELSPFVKIHDARELGYGIRRQIDSHSA